MTTVEEKAGSGGGRVSKEGLRGFFREMLLIRRFEEKVEERFRAGELPGFLHVAIGQEAVASGVCAALEREDVIASTHRAHGHSIAKGTPIERIMAELYGKIEGCSHGYGGSMHLYDVEVGNLGANAVVAGGIPGIVGAALAFQMRDEKRVAVAFFGDGATNAGTFHESLNLAQLWKVPAIFVLENNGWAESTPAKQHLPLPVDELGKRALAYGMKLIEADGQDVEAVYLAALAAREHALSGSGPVLLHLRTYRLVGHYVGDPAGLPGQGGARGGQGDEGSDRAPARPTRALRRRVRLARRRDHRPRSRPPSSSRRREPIRSPRTRSPTCTRQMPELTYREAVRDALSRALREDDNVFLMGEDIAEMGGSMAVTQGLLDEFGPTADPQHADLGDGDRRQRDRRRDPGDATRGRDHVRGLPHAVHGAARQPGGEAPDDVGRSGDGAAHGPDAGWRGLVARRAARPAARVVVRARPRPQGRLRVDARGRPRPPLVGDLRRQSGRLLRAPHACIR